ncbi:ribonuclease E activity regulator RraA [Streptomyces sp. MS1.HAVA.3]|uniref:4-hydroxy-4-methyl-2-oxoglutarate aldolase n=1 Tax=Streptomyces caledonius TaxID=3134107 RepID=A0ABU8TYK8_9ACTN
MSVTPVPTADLYDEYGEALGICATEFRPFGGRRLFAGPVRTVQCHEDNALLRGLVQTPGDGAVLVVDGGGSPRTALVGDLLAGAAERNGWAGLIINGSVRDSVALGGLDLGIKALGTVPARAARPARARSTSPSPSAESPSAPGTPSTRTTTAWSSCPADAPAGQNRPGPPHRPWQRPGGPGFTAGP